jgi:hypothetical protein
MVSTLNDFIYKKNIGITKVRLCKAYRLKKQPPFVKTKYSDPRTLTFYDRQYRYEVKQLNKGNGRK